MVEINWEDYKEFKTAENLEGDNFDILIIYLKSFYNMKQALEIYETLYEDELTRRMLEKREINDADMLDDYMRKR
ncbi:MAG: hypothetical protein RBR59_09415 [Sulfurimonadaceae bacterium]|jgi:hypothetical protein|nr:hypothetical protein [Sulfurimonadaceae bacterium]